MNKKNTKRVSKKRTKTVSKKRTKKPELPNWKKDILRIVIYYNMGKLSIVTLPFHPVLRKNYYNDNLLYDSFDELIEKAYKRVKKFLEGYVVVNEDVIIDKKDEFDIIEGSKRPAKDEMVLCARDWQKVYRQKFPKELEKKLSELDKKGANVPLIFGWLYIICNVALSMIIHFLAAEDKLLKIDKKKKERKEKEKMKYYSSLFDVLSSRNSKVTSERKVKDAAQAHLASWDYEPVQELNELRRNFGIDKRSNIKIRKNTIWTLIICKLVEELKNYVKNIRVSVHSPYPQEGFVVAAKLLRYACPLVWDYDDKTVNSLKARFYAAL